MLVAVPATAGRHVRQGALLSHLSCTREKYQPLRNVLVDVCCVCSSWLNVQCIVHQGQTVKDMNMLQAAWQGCLAGGSTGLLGRKANNRHAIYAVQAAHTARNMAHTV